jgi:hypothetical protein
MGVRMGCSSGFGRQLFDRTLFVHYITATGTCVPILQSGKESD